MATWRTGDVQTGTHEKLKGSGSRSQIHSTEIIITGRTYRTDQLA